MGDKGQVLACDLHENKLKRIREGAARLGISCIETAAADGRVMHEAWRDGFDAVLVDAPCSGLGIIRKKPDIRYKRPDDLFTLPVAQSAILANASGYVRPGGTLVSLNSFVTRETLASLPDDARRALLREYPFISDSLYEDTVLAGFRKIDSEAAGSWSTEEDRDSSIAGFARSLGITIEFTQYIRFCEK